MKHPLHKKMPLLLDVTIRTRLFLEWVKKRKQAASFLGGILLAPTLAAIVLLIQPSGSVQQTDLESLIAEIQAAQVAEIEKGASGIYHVKRRIVEGSDKPKFVASELGVEAEVTQRVDEIETWQHNDTALALIESNGTNYGFEAFLSLEHEGYLQLYHYGEDEQEREGNRVAYDTAHDVASLYAHYKSLERPTVPDLPSNATFIAFDAEEDSVLFLSRATEGIEVIHVVDVDSKLVTEEIIYILSPEGNKYEMTRITYSERSTIPAERFEDVFDLSRFQYEMITNQQRA